jgi:small-conductance mechanosensitive channel
MIQHDKCEAFEQIIKIKDAKIAELEKKLEEAEKAFEDKKRALNSAINMWDIETKKLEKHNEMLAHQLKYAETILTDVQADKFKLRGKLKIAVEALEKIDKSNDCMKYFNNDIYEIIYETREALAAIKDN